MGPPICTRLPPSTDIRKPVITSYSIHYTKLYDDLGYFVPEPEIVNARNFGVPQNRERIYIVGFRNDLGITEFNYPESTDKSKVFMDVREKEAKNP